MAADDEGLVANHAFETDTMPKDRKVVEKNGSTSGKLTVRGASLGLRPDLYPRVAVGYQRLASDSMSSSCLLPNRFR